MTKPVIDFEQAQKFIEPLNLGGLKGRMLFMPGAGRYKNQKILFIYGQHASLERMWGLMEVLNHYGEVAMPDLPGFGGMDSFYKIDRKPSLDNLADYLAMFIRWRYKNDKIVLAGLSFGFLVATRMLQRHPKLQDKVKLFISIVGFAHKGDFTFSRPRMAFYKYGSAFFTLRVPAYFAQHVLLQPIFIRTIYKRLYNAKVKFDGKAGEEMRRTMDFEINLWSINDFRTQMYCNGEMFRLDLCQVRVDLPIYHVVVGKDQYFDNKVVEQHLRVIFSDYHGLKSKIGSHSISVISDKKMAEPMVPAELKRILRRSAI